MIWELPEGVDLGSRMRKRGERHDRVRLNTAVDRDEIRATAIYTVGHSRRCHQANRRVIAQ